MLELLEGKASAGELTDEQQAEVSATLAWIDQKIKEVGDERMVCERRATLGSNRKGRVCMTAAQMRAQREATRGDRSGARMFGLPQQLIAFRLRSWAGGDGTGWTARMSEGQGRGFQHEDVVRIRPRCRTARQNSLVRKRGLLK